MQTTNKGLGYLRSQIEIAENIYNSLSPEVKKHFPIRWNFNDSRSESETLLSSLFFSRVSGLDRADSPTPNNIETRLSTNGDSKPNELYRKAFQEEELK